MKDLENLITNYLKNEDDISDEYDFGTRLYVKIDDIEIINKEGGYYTYKVCYQTASNTYQGGIDIGAPDDSIRYNVIYLLERKNKIIKEYSATEYLRLKNNREDISFTGSIPYYILSEEGVFLDKEEIICKYFGTNNKDLVLNGLLLSYYNVFVNVRGKDYIISNEFKDIDSKLGYEAYDKKYMPLEATNILVQELNRRNILLESIKGYENFDEGSNEKELRKNITKLMLLL